MCHQNEAGSYAKQTIRGEPPGAKQPIMAAPVCVTSQQEAELALVSSQSPAEWLISLLDWRGDRMLNGKPPLCGTSLHTCVVLLTKKGKTASLLACKWDLVT